MPKGGVLLDDTTRNVFAQPEVLAETFVKPPQITRLAQALHPYGIPREVLSVEETKEAFYAVYNGHT